MLLNIFVSASTHPFRRYLGFNSATLAASPSPAGRGLREKRNKPIENDTGKEVQYTKTNVRITFHSVWAINRASPCPFWHCCTWHLLFPHLLISSTFLCLIPSYTVVQPLTFYCISFFPFSFFFYLLSHFLNCHFLWNSQMITRESQTAKNHQVLSFALHVTLKQDVTSVQYWSLQVCWQTGSIFAAWGWSDCKLLWVEAVCLFLWIGL